MHHVYLKQNYKFTRFLLLAVLCFLVMHSCGGGGGGKHSEVTIPDFKLAGEVIDQLEAERDWLVDQLGLND